MTIEEIKNHVRKYNETKGWSADDDSVIETIMESDALWEGNRESHRHWNDIDKVVEIDGLLIMFTDCETTGDLGPSDLGWEFDPSTISLAEAQEIKTTTYKRV